jgi:outer membrane protein OmpA-like peptidoglycan-associated protein
MKYFYNYTNFILESDNTNVNNLQIKLDEWNKKYSQAFKFENDMPKDIKNLSPNGTVVSYLIQDVISGLKNMVEILNNNPEFIGKEVQIKGHTSTPATNDYNKSLSDKRCQYVANNLMTNKDLKNKCVIKKVGEAIDATKINLIIVPMGESEPIIVNDTAEIKDVNELKSSKDYESSLKSIIQQLGDKSKDLISNLDFRHSFNRRVEITLPKFSPVPPEIFIPDELPKITLPSLTVKFNPNSYIFQNKSNSDIDKYINDVNEYNKKNTTKITNIYIDINISLAIEDDISEQKKMQRKLLFIIVCNRGFKLKQKLSGIANVNIEFFPYINNTIINGSAYNVNSNDMCNIVYNINDLKNKNQFKDDLATNGIENIQVGKDGECVMENIINNDLLKQVLLQNLQSYKNDNRVPTKEEANIPIELWNTTYGDGKEMADCNKKALDILQDKKDWLEIYKLQPI